MTRTTNHVVANSKLGRQLMSVRNKSTNPIGTYPEQSEKQLEKKYEEVVNPKTGFKTIRRVK